MQKMEFQSHHSLIRFPRETQEAPLISLNYQKILIKKKLFHLYKYSYGFFQTPVIPLFDCLFRASTVHYIKRFVY